MADEDEKETGTKKKTGAGMIKKLLVLMIGLAIIGAGGFAGWQFFYKKKVETVEKQVFEKFQMYPLGAKVVNLLDNNGERYLKVDVQLEVSGAECVAELEELKPKITDAVLVLLSSKKYKEIAGFEGKQRLRDEIAMRLNSYLSRGQVQRVYFTEFIIQ